MVLTLWFSLVSAVTYRLSSFPHPHSLLPTLAYTWIPGYRRQRELCACAWRSNMLAALELITVTLGESIPHSQLATGPAQGGFHPSWLVRVDIRGERTKSSRLRTSADQTKLHLWNKHNKRKMYYTCKLKYKSSSYLILL